MQFKLNQLYIKKCKIIMKKLKQLEQKGFNTKMMWKGIRNIKA